MARTCARGQAHILVAEGPQTGGRVEAGAGGRAGSDLKMVDSTTHRQHPGVYRHIEARLDLRRTVAEFSGAGCNDWAFGLLGMMGEPQSS